MNSNYHSSPYEILHTQGYELLEKSENLREKGEESFDLLARVLTLSGLAMGIAGESSPASGTEHIITHLIDMYAESRGQQVAFHGAQVAVSSIITAVAWDIFLSEFNPSEVDLDTCFPSFEKMKLMVYEAFSEIDSNGETSKECWCDYERKLARWHKNKNIFMQFLLNWSSFKERVENMLLSPEFLSKCMHKAGAPTRFSQMTPTVNATTARWAITNCHLFRNRFTLSDLMFYTGWWTDEFINRVIDRAEKIDAGL
jgi:glycerol-1-phosphate dehydrogenase [NAD(P)+]